MTVLSRDMENVVCLSGGIILNTFFDNSEDQFVRTTLLWPINPEIPKIKPAFIHCVKLKCISRGILNLVF